MSHSSAPAEKSTEKTGETEDSNHAPTCTRNDLQLSRRAFHFSTGTIVATLYHLYLSHQSVVYLLGSVASALYVFEQIRVNYPEMQKKTVWLNRFFLRAEEQLQESASVPYAMGLLLTILTFPKIPAVIAIYTLAVSDPLSAIYGIRFGKTKILGRKSVEGSIAFLVSCFACVLLVLLGSVVSFPLALVAGCFIAVAAAGLELIPSRIDDNLTIPLGTALVAWTVLTLLGLPLA